MTNPAPTTPSIDDQSAAFPVGLIVMCGAAFGSYAIGFIFWPELTAPGLSPLSTVLWCIGWCGLIVAMCFCTVAWRWRNGQRRSAIICAGVFALLCWGGLGMGMGTGVRAQCGAWTLRQGTIFRGVYQEYRSRLDTGKPLPASVFLPMIEHGGPEAFINRCGPCGLAQASIGGISMLDLAEGRATMDDLRCEAERVNAGQSWEAYGNYVMCRDPRAFAGNNSQVLLGFVYPRHHPGVERNDGESASTLWADCRCEET